MKKKIKKIIEDIKRLKIQSAETIAKTAISVLKEENTKEVKKALINARPTEPCLANIIKLIEKQGFKKAEKYFITTEKKINRFVYNLIKNGINIYTHCHSTNVVNSLIYAAKHKKRFVVYNTETRPKYQGRKTALELAKAGIKVIHGVDTMMNHFIKKCDLILLGCDAILGNGNVINKIGSSIIAKLAKNYDVPLYIVSPALKFSPKTVFGKLESLEKRPSKEVWNIKHRNIKIINQSFDEIEKENITAIISEFGVLDIDIFIEKFLETYKFLL